MIEDFNPGSVVRHQDFEESILLGLGGVELGIHDAVDESDAVNLSENGASWVLLQQLSVSRAAKLSIGGTVF